jgi:hypothetical protein
MSMLRFAALEARVNAAVIDRLSDRQASFTPRGGGAARPVTGMYDAAYGTQLEQMAGDSSPALTVRTDLVLDATPGASLILLALIDANGVVVAPEETFEVVEAQPDGAGFTALRLRTA